MLILLTETPFAVEHPTGAFAGQVDVSVAEFQIGFKGRVLFGESLNSIGFWINVVLEIKFSNAFEISPAKGSSPWWNIAFLFGIKLNPWIKSITSSNYNRIKFNKYK